MANAASHSLPVPIYGALYNCFFEFRKSDGTTIAPASCDTEASLDAGTFADCTNEITLIKEVGGSTDSAYGYLTLTAAEMTAQAVVLQSKSTATAVTVGQIIRPKQLTSVRAGTAQAGAASTITLDAGASAVDDFYNGLFVRTNGGTGPGQARLITDYVGSTKVATVAFAWETNPSSNTTFTVGFVENQSVNSFQLDAATSSRLAPTTAARTHHRCGWPLR